MFKEVYLTITACFQPSGTAVVSGSRKARLATYSHSWCANLSHNQTMCLQQRAGYQFSAYVHFTAASSEQSAFCRPRQRRPDSLPPCQGPDSWPLCSKLKGGSKLLWRTQELNKKAWASSVGLCQKHNHNIPTTTWRWARGDSQHTKPSHKCVLG